VSRTQGRHEEFAQNSLEVQPMAWSERLRCTGTLLTLCSTGFWRCSFLYVRRCVLNGLLASCSVTLLITASYHQNFVFCAQFWAPQSKWAASSSESAIVCSLLSSTEKWCTNTLIVPLSCMVRRFLYSEERIWPIWEQSKYLNVRGIKLVDEK
jgi:hypothetical protein